jgi:hypothetical protein
MEPMRALDRGLKAQNGGVEAQNGAVEGRPPLVADSHNVGEEQNPDLRIRIFVKSRILLDTDVH